MEISKEVTVSVQMHAWSMSCIILQETSYLLAHTDSFTSPPVGVFMIVHPMEAQP